MSREFKVTSCVSSLAQCTGFDVEQNVLESSIKENILVSFIITTLSGMFLDEQTFPTVPAGVSLL